MTASNNREFGLRNFSEALLTPELMTSDMHLLEAYGLYLANGGTPEGFMNLTQDDISIMYTSMKARDTKLTSDILEGLVKILSKLFKGDS